MTSNVTPFPTAQSPDIVQMLLALLEEARKTNALLREEIDLLRNMPRGGYNNKPQPDVIISQVEGDFVLEFKLKFAKEDDQKAKNKERKAAIQALVTSGLSANKHYRIVKVPKSNDKGKTWDEWYFHFPPQHAQAVKERIKQAIETHKAQVDNLDILDKLCEGVEQVVVAIPQPKSEAAANPQHNQQMKLLHALGGEYALLLGVKWDDIRRGYATRTTSKIVDSFNDYSPAQLSKIIEQLQADIKLAKEQHLQEITELGTQLHGAKWMFEKEHLAVLWASDKRTQDRLELRASEIFRLRDMLETKVNQERGEKERRL